MQFLHLEYTNSIIFIGSTMVKYQPAEEPGKINFI
jgi:hypothetical protein